MNHKWCWFFVGLPLKLIAFIVATPQIVHVKFHLFYINTMCYHMTNKSIWEAIYAVIVQAIVAFDAMSGE